MVRNLEKTNKNNAVVFEQELQQKVGDAAKNCRHDTLHEAVLAAAQAAGGQYGEKGLVSYLEAQAIAVPSPFLTLLGKVLGQTSEGETRQITRIEIVAPTLDPAAAAHHHE